MTDQLIHRGPDDEGYAFFLGCALGHRRLSIIDLSTGAQPMTEISGRFWISYNGEIYNYRELRRELEGKGFHFRTQSDTEVILQAYAAYDEAMLNHLNGQFAFAIWDTTQHRLFAARDRIGEKPFYFATSDKGDFLFASEIKALLASGLIQPRLDLLSVNAYLALLYVPPDRTIYENIHTLRPGHALVWESGGWRVFPYWQPSYAQSAKISPEETLEHLRFLIEQAVRRQMVADVPVGAFLSGGLDSSTIVALMSKTTDLPIQTFSVGFGDLINELPFARQVADKYHTNHHELQMNIPVAEMVERMADVYDEPFADSSNIPTYLLAQYTRQNVKVALSGDGGDELFGGYDWYKWLYGKQPHFHGAVERSVLQVISLGLRILTLSGLPLKKWRDAVTQGLKVEKVNRNYSDIWDRHLALTSGVNRDWAKYSSAKQPGNLSVTMRSVYQPDEIVKGMDRATDFDIRAYLPGDILVKVDRATLAHGLESRAPFLDVDLVDFVIGLPWQIRFQEGDLKILLRQSCSDLWTDSIRRRGKQGFGAPLRNWVYKPAVRAQISRVSRNGGPLNSLFPSIGKKLNWLTPQNQWTFLCLGLWLERHEDCLIGLK